MGVKTRAFIITLSVFFAVVALLTFYSKQVFLKSLPVVEVAMPQRAELLANGRYAYEVPVEAVRYNMKTSTYYVLLLKEASDVLGDNYYPAAAVITLLYRDDVTAKIDGLVYVEPVILTIDSRVEAGSRLLVDVLPER